MNWLKQAEEEYRGEHGAPGREGASADDLTRNGGGVLSFDQFDYPSKMRAEAYESVAEEELLKTKTKWDHKDEDPDFNLVYSETDIRDTAEELYQLAVSKYEDQRDEFENALKVTTESHNGLFSYHRADGGTKYYTVTAENDKEMSVRQGDHQQLYYKGDAVEFVDVSNLGPEAINPKNALERVAKFLESNRLTQYSASRGNADIEGSVNMRLALTRGDVLGTGIYANTVPHHQRHNGGAWTYENMFNLHRDISIGLVIDGEYTVNEENGTTYRHDGKEISVDNIPTRTRFPKISNSWENDYEDAVRNQTASTFLVQQQGNTENEVPLTESGYYVTSEDGFDQVTKNDNTWVAEAFKSSLTRPAINKGETQYSAGTLSAMNWYKAAQSKSLEELLQSLDSNPGVDRKTLAWLKALESKEKGLAINRLTKNPSASIEEMQRLFTKVVPLTEEQERLVRIYPLIGEWMRGVMSVLSGQKREMAFNTLREKAAGIRDWIDRTGERLQGRTLENAVKETEKWHSESYSLERGEYLPTKKEDIVIQYRDGYSWQRISSGTDAKIEGQKMNHCVGNYCDDVDEGKIDLYSLRDENNSPLITAGFKHKGAVVVQMKGAANADPRDEYQTHITDILDNLGTVYNDGEEYLNNYNLKNFADLNADDIEKSILLQKIVNNQIAREGDPPDFALPWARMKLDSGAAPKAWEEAISSHIVEYGYPPEFGYYWAKKVLESGRAPKEWEAAINSHIGLGKSIGNWALVWSKNKLESGLAPKAWEAEITSRIVKMKDPPEFGYYWAKRILESGAAPQEWQAGITSHIERVGYPPTWAQKWAKKILDSGRAPKAWETGMTSYIAKNVEPPMWAQDWVKKILDSGAVPKEWEEAITSSVAKLGSPPDWARDWAKKILDSGEAPKAWEAGITSRIERVGSPPFWAQNWYYKNGKYKR